jgi:uncharacterized protein (TIGR02466 family)
LSKKRAAKASPEAVQNKTRLRKESYFPTPIFFVDLETAEQLNADLLPRILEWRAENPDGIVRSNATRVGAWHSAQDAHRRSAFHPLALEIFDHARSVFDDQGYDPNFEPALEMMWVNISPRFGFNRYHNHPGVLWSGVYYVKAPENSGRISFTDPRAQAHVIEAFFPDSGPRSPELWSEVFFEPFEGRLILFPAWLYHQVEPNLAEGQGDASERISISFNIFQRRKGVQSHPEQGPIVRSDIAPA